MKEDIDMWLARLMMLVCTTVAVASGSSGPASAREPAETPVVDWGYNGSVFFLQLDSFFETDVDRDRRAASGFELAENAEYLHVATDHWSGYVRLPAELAQPGVPVGFSCSPDQLIAYRDGPISRNLSDVLDQELVVYEFSVGSLSFEPVADIMPIIRERLEVDHEYYTYGVKCLQMPVPSERLGALLLGFIYVDQAEGSDDLTVTADELLILDARADGEIEVVACGSFPPGESPYYDAWFTNDYVVLVPWFERRETEWMTLLVLPLESASLPELTGFDLYRDDARLLDEWERRGFTWHEYRGGWLGMDGSAYYLQYGEDLGSVESVSLTGDEVRTRIRLELPY